ncbi:Phosphate transport system permease protein PstA OS=Streptomyces cyaneofuscatus OX=66883 GN=pstA PE=3 SV=1 [Streptomyces cyaneofuscatus]
MSHASTAVQERPTPPGGHGAPKSALTSRSLPRLAPVGFAAVAIALSVGISTAAGWHSKVQWGMIAALLFLAISYVATTVVENKRQAKDRLATSVVWVCFLIAIIPLVSLLWTTISRGAERLDGYFLTHSMAGVLGSEASGGVYHALIGTLEQVGIATVISARSAC